jgi:hypothetical protein
MSRGPRTERSNLLLLAGIVLLAQVVLYGPSLIGTRILLPLDLLASRGEIGTETAFRRPQSVMLSDLINVIEPWRRFAASEIRAGRLPLWNPYSYCGSPFLAANQPAIFSPYHLLDYLFPGPMTIAWAELVQALVGATGAYLFFRKALSVSVTPAFAGACAFPQIGFMVLWQGFPLTRVASLLPWVLLAVHACVEKPGPLPAVGLAAATAVMLVAGHLPLAALCLLASAGYLAGCLSFRYGSQSLLTRAAARGALVACLGWTGGLMLAAPQTLPTLEYLGSSRRFAVTATAPSELAVLGLAHLPQVLLQHYYGSDRIPSIYSGVRGIQLESGAMGYAGLLSALVAAPLAWCLCRHRRMAWFWAGWTLLSFSCLLIPTLWTAVELTPLRLLSLHRLPLLGAMGILVLAVLGLEACQSGKGKGAWKLALGPGVILAVLGLRCALQAAAARSLAPPGAGAEIIAGTQRLHALGAVFSLLGLGLWGLIVWRPRWMGAGLVGGLLAFETVAMARGAAVQCDPGLYYPLSPVIEKLAGHSDFRVTGLICLQPNLSMMYGLRDVRGYDGVDPRRIIELLDLCREPGSGEFSYSALSAYTPLPGPITDLLGIRYAVLRRPRPGAGRGGAVEADILERDALPRVSVPRSVEVVADDALRLARLGDSRFDPRQVAFVESAPSGPVTDARGTAILREDFPARLVIEARMETRGLVLVADQWDRGWKATVDGRPSPILRTDHALRGIEVDRGVHTVVMTYWPASLSVGLLLSALGACGLGAACIVRLRRG